jgi:hypothetical protein
VEGIGARVTGPWHSDILCRNVGGSGRGRDDARGEGGTRRGRCNRSAHVSLEFPGRFMTLQCPVLFSASIASSLYRTCVSSFGFFLSSRVYAHPFHAVIMISNRSFIEPRMVNATEPRFAATFIDDFLIKLDPAN